MEHLALPWRINMVHYKPNMDMLVVSMESFQSSISMTATILSLLFCGFIVHLLTRKIVGKHSKKRYHPIGGTIFNQLMNYRRLHHYMTDLAHKHKTYRLISLFRNDVYTSDPVNVEYILRTNFDNYGKVHCFLDIPSDALLFFWKAILLINILHPWLNTSKVREKHPYRYKMMTK